MAFRKHPPTRNSPHHGQYANRRARKCNQEDLRDEHDAHVADGGDPYDIGPCSNCAFYATGNQKCAPHGSTLAETLYLQATASNLQAPFVAPPKKKPQGKGYPAERLPEGWYGTEIPITEDQAFFGELPEFAEHFYKNPLLYLDKAVKKYQNPQNSGQFAPNNGMIQFGQQPYFQQQSNIQYGRYAGQPPLQQQHPYPQYNQYAPPRPVQQRQLYPQHNQYAQPSRFAFPQPQYAFPQPQYGFPQPQYGFPQPQYAYPQPQYAFPQPPYGHQSQGYQAHPFSALPSVDALDAAYRRGLQNAQRNNGNEAEDGTMDTDTVMENGPNGRF